MDAFHQRAKDRMLANRLTNSSKSPKSRTPNKSRKSRSSSADNTTSTSPHSRKPGKKYLKKGTGVQAYKNNFKNDKSRERNDSKTNKIYPKTRGTPSPIKINKSELNISPLVRKNVSEKAISSPYKPNSYSNLGNNKKKDNVGKRMNNNLSPRNYTNPQSSNWNNNSDNSTGGRIMDDYKPFEFSFKVQENLEHEFNKIDIKKVHKSNRDVYEIEQRIAVINNNKISKSNSDLHMKSKKSPLKKINNEWQLNSSGNNSLERINNFKKKNTPANIKNMNDSKNFKDFVPSFQPSSKNNYQKKSNNQVIYHQIQSERKSMNKTSETFMENKSNTNHKSKGGFRTSNGFNAFDGTYGSGKDLNAGKNAWNFNESESKITTAKSNEISESYLNNNNEVLVRKKICIEPEEMSGSPKKRQMQFQMENQHQQKQREKKLNVPTQVLFDNLKEFLVESDRGKRRKSISRSNSPLTEQLHDKQKQISLEKYGTSPTKPNKLQQKNNKLKVSNNRTSRFVDNNTDDDNLAIIDDVDLSKSNVKLPYSYKNDSNMQIVDDCDFEEPRLKNGLNFDECNPNIERNSNNYYANNINSNNKKNRSTPIEKDCNINSNVFSDYSQQEEMMAYMQDKMGAENFMIIYRTIKEAIVCCDDLDSFQDNDGYMALNFKGCELDVVSNYALDLTNLCLIEKILDESEKNNFQFHRGDSGEY